MFDLGIGEGRYYVCRRGSRYKRLGPDECLHGVTRARCNRYRRRRAGVESPALESVFSREHDSAMDASTCQVCGRLVPPRLRPCLTVELEFFIGHRGKTTDERLAIYSGLEYFINVKYIVPRLV